MGRKLYINFQGLNVLKRKEHEHTEMQIIRTDNDIDWLPKPNKVTIMISDLLPERNLITCSFILAFSGDEVLITDLHARGLDIPGGHIEAGESAEEAVERELFEETGARIVSAQLLGYLRLKCLAKNQITISIPSLSTTWHFFGRRSLG